jgi:hypothetical protein
MVHMSNQDLTQIIMYEYGILKAFTAWLGGHLTYKLGVREHSIIKEECLVRYVEGLQDNLKRAEDSALFCEAYSKTKAINNGVYALCVMSWAICLGFSL